MDASDIQPEEEILFKGMDICLNTDEQNGRSGRA
jgi:hypothetical protein